MNAGAKLAAFGAVVAVGFGGAMAVGAAVGPIDVGGDDEHATSRPPAAALPRGLSSADAGYRLVVDSRSVDAGAATRLGFEIVDGGGVPLTAFEELHERPLHLIVLSRNLVDYFHLHPMMDDSGHWGADLPSLDPGSYRVFADFQPVGGENLTLGTDLDVAGELEGVALPEPSETASVDGYDVTLDAAPTVGDSELGFTVTHDGAQVTTDPYLGAAGHLVAIRSADLAYLHVHPHGATASPVVTFTGEFPTAGTYRVFFEFSHDGTVHTAKYTVVVPDQSDADHGASLLPESHDTVSHDDR